MALWRAKIKPPVELVVDDLEIEFIGNGHWEQIMTIGVIGLEGIGKI